MSDASAGTGIASRQGCGRLKHLEVKWLWVQEKVSEKALRLKKHSTETNIADLATKYRSRPRMEMLLAAGNIVLVSGEKRRNGEYVRMDSEVTRLLFIVLFLFVGCVFIGALYYVHAELNGFPRVGTEGEYVGNRLDKGLEIAGTGD